MVRSKKEDEQVEEEKPQKSIENYIPEGSNIEQLIDKYQTSNVNSEKQNIAGALFSYVKEYLPEEIQNIPISMEYPDEIVKASERSLGTRTKNWYRNDLEELVDWRLDNTSAGSVYVSFLPMLEELSTEMGGSKFNDNKYHEISDTLEKIDQGELSEEKAHKMAYSAIEEHLTEYLEEADENDTLTEYIEEDLEHYCDIGADLMENDTRYVTGLYLSNEVEPYYEEEGKEKYPIMLQM